jgi:hypothetical protein
LSLKRVSIGPRSIVKYKNSFDLLAMEVGRRS